MLSTTNLSQVRAIFSKIGKNDEFEIMFNNYKADNILSLIDFMNVVKYIKFRSQEGKYKLNELNVLGKMY